MKIALLIACYNDVGTVAGVMISFMRRIPNAVVYVYDNCSDDDTVGIAGKAGPVIVSAKIKGKGNVTHKIFADINTDVYAKADADSIYTSDDCGANRKK
jgi:hypothetical protein